MAKTVKEETPKVVTEEPIAEKEVVIESTTVEDKQEDEVVVVAPVVKANPVIPKQAVVTEVAEKKVKIHCVEEVESIISGTTYRFRKDANVEVPAGIAAILVRGKKAYRN